MTDQSLHKAEDKTQLMELLIENISCHEDLLQEWMGRVVDSDQAALGLLYDHLLDAVYGLAFRITNRVQLAEEVAQETFWQVWRQAPRFNPERGTVKAWVMTIARSRAIDSLRQLEGKETQLMQETIEMAEYLEAPADLLLALQEGEHLHNAMASLDPVPRQLISMAFFRGLSHEEIASYTDIPLGTVKSHIRRALHNLQNRLLENVTGSKV